MTLLVTPNGAIWNKKQLNPAFGRLGEIFLALTAALAVEAMFLGYSFASMG